MVTYFNTTSETNPQLADYRDQAASQQDRILLWFHRNGKPASPSMVWAQVFDGKTPITSVRRAMTCLANDNLLVRSDRKRDGIYGRPEHFWKLPSNQIELFD